MPGRTASVYRRRRAIAAGLVVIALLAAAAVFIHACSAGAKRLEPAAGDSGGHYDPLAYDDGREATFEQRAAAGLAQLLYEKSPGGAYASARRTDRWRPLIERAARPAGVDPDLVEAMVLLESAGRPNVIAGNDPASAAGLGQILAGTATELLGMHVDLATSRALTKRILHAAAIGKTGAIAKLQARRRRIDDRFAPAKAIAGTVRYLALAKKHFGRDDLAVASYHMGIGNLDNVLRLFGAGKPAYARVYFDSTPLLHPAAYKLLSAFGDDSSTYLWRVYAAREILRLYRQQPQQLAALQRLHDASDSAEYVLHPPGSVGAGPLVEPPAGPRLAQLGLAFGVPPGKARVLRPAALAALVYIGVGTRAIAGPGQLRVAAAAGYGFAIARRYRDHRQALAFQFMLDRLQTLNLIAWRRDGDRIDVVAASDADKLLGAPAKLVSDALR